MRIGMLVVVATLGAALGRASAQSHSSTDAGLEAYRLTMPNVRKMAGVYERLDSALTVHPSLAAKLAHDKAPRPSQS
jgi:hypothetical protein